MNEKEKLKRESELPFEIKVILERIDMLRITSKRVLTQQELADYIGVPYDSVYRLVSEKRIPVYKMGNRSFFIREEIENWLTETKIHTNKEQQERAEAYERNKERREERERNIQQPPIRTRKRRSEQRKMQSAAYERNKEKRLSNG